jgi:uncharacterized protein YcfJ
MKNLVFAGVATTALVLAAFPAIASDSFVSSPIGVSAAAIANVSVAANGVENTGMSMPKMGGMPMGGMHMPKTGGMPMGGMHMPKMGGMPNMPHPNMGGNHGSHGQWQGARNAPGGYSSYRQPFRGYILPSYWVNPSFYIGGYSNYGLRAPTSGYNWSRYYDDAVLTDNRGYVYDSVNNVPWDNYPANNGPVPYAQPEYAPALSTDQGVYRDYDLPANSETEAGTYQGQWTGAYVDPQRQTYRGEWAGTYTNDEGQVYEGTYRGTSVGAPVYTNGAGNGSNYGYAPVAPPHYAVPAPMAAPSSPGAPYQAAPYQAAPYQQAPAYYSTPRGYESYERCLKGRGIAGGAIGAIIGAVAGNRIAGHGDRLVGSLIGGGVGALAGVGIEKAVNKCERYLPVPQQQYRPAPQGYYPAQPQSYYPQQQPYGYGWYYQQQAPVTTVTVVPGNVVTTTTTTEEVVYDNVYTRVPMKGKGLRRPVATRTTCGC